MLRFRLKTLFFFVSACAAYLAASQSAGYFVTAGCAASAGALFWATLSSLRGLQLATRIVAGSAALAALWFLAVDWSWFVWRCDDCGLLRETYQYRVLGRSVSSEQWEGNRLTSWALSDLGVPCLHRDSHEWHKHRWWGLGYCAGPCWNGTHALLGDDSRYSEAVSLRATELGRSEPDFAREVYRKRIVERDAGFFWDVFMADVIALGALDSGAAHEARSWMAASTEDHLRLIGERLEQHASQDTIEAFYSAGARRVLAIEIDDYHAVVSGTYTFPEGCFAYQDIVENPKDNPEFRKLHIKQAKALAIELPDDAATRTRIFDCRNVIEVSAGGTLVEDQGQAFQLLFLD